MASTWRTALGLIAAIAGVCSARASIDESSARRKALDFLAKVAPSVRAPVTSATEIGTNSADRQRHRWDVRIGQGFRVELDAESGEPLSLKDIEREALANSPKMPSKGVPFFDSSNELERRGRSTLSSIRWNSSGDAEFGYFPKPDPLGEVPRGVLWVRLYERANGYPAAGNCAGASFDSITGELISVDRTIGFTYAEPLVKVSKAQAAEAASRELRERVPVEAVSGPKYWYLNAAYQESARAGELISQQRLLLSYRVRLPEHTLVVSAADGAVLTRVDSRIGPDLTGRSRSGNIGGLWFLLAVALMILIRQWARSRST